MHLSSVAIQLNSPFVPSLFRLTTNNIRNTWALMKYCRDDGGTLVQKVSDNGTKSDDFIAVHSRTMSVFVRPHICWAVGEWASRRMHITTLCRYNGRLQYIDWEMGTKVIVQLHVSQLHLLLLLLLLMPLSSQLNWYVWWGVQLN